MGEFFQSIDASFFMLINTTLSNPLFDAVMPAITDWHKTIIGQVLAFLFLLMLNWKGGRKGRIVTLLLVMVILCCDQLSSGVLKSVFARPRPCHEIVGARVISNIHLLVDCGSGYSFPSTHAVNNFGFAVLLSYYFRRLTIPLFCYAFLMGFSRVVVGVHYPFDVLGGALLGGGIATAFIGVWNTIGERFPFLNISHKEGKMELPVT